MRDLAIGIGSVLFHVVFLFLAASLFQPNRSHRPHREKVSGRPPIQFTSFEIYIENASALQKSDVSKGEKQETPTSADESTPSSSDLSDSGRIFDADRSDPNAREAEPKKRRIDPQSPTKVRGSAIPQRNEGTPQRRIESEINDVRMEPELSTAGPHQSSAGFSRGEGLLVMRPSPRALLPGPGTKRIALQEPLLKAEAKQKPMHWVQGTDGEMEYFDPDGDFVGIIHRDGTVTFETRSRVPTTICILSICVDAGRTRTPGESHRKRFGKLRGLRFEPLAGGLIGARGKFGSKRGISEKQQQFLVQTQAIRRERELSYFKQTLTEYVVTLKRRLEMLPHAETDIESELELIVDELNAAPTSRESPNDAAQAEFEYLLRAKKRCICLVSAFLNRECIELKSPRYCTKIKAQLLSQVDKSWECR